MGGAGGVRRTQIGVGESAMIHWRRTVQIAPGRQAEAIARDREWQPLKTEHGLKHRTTLVTTGTLGRLCWSHDYESMAAMEAEVDKLGADPRVIALLAKVSQEHRDGTSPFVHDSYHDEIWRDA